MRRSSSSAGSSDVAVRGAPPRNKLFRCIQMDIKDRDRQRKKLGPVSSVGYIDPQRSIGVALGQKDIRKDILKHRGKLKDSMLAEEIDSPGFLLLHEQAERELRAGRAEVASAYLDRALRYNII